MRAAQTLSDATSTSHKVVYIVAWATFKFKFREGSPSMYRSRDSDSKTDDESTRSAEAE